MIIHVTDQGPGITEDEQSRIFEKFYRGTQGQHLKGTGMGLAIAREIVRAHGEDLRVRSSPAKDRTFILRFRLFRGMVFSDRGPHPRSGR